MGMLLELDGHIAGPTADRSGRRCGRAAWRLEAAGRIGEESRRTGRLI
ncbi:MAG: hypothetical protein QHG94_04820 [Candidatus Methanosuratincola sp.]|nr:hypothetical protein [Candidatus Methanosuratincola sp.]